MTPGRPVEGFVAAGGASSRMGRDKASLPWRSGTLLEHAIQSVTVACGGATVLCGPEARFSDLAPIAIDRYAGCGPLAALHAALDTARSEQILLLAVDMPRVPVALLEHLVENAGSADVVVPRLADGPQPLCATYSRRCLDAVRRGILAGDYKMTGFWPGVAVREIDGVELGAFGDPSRIFTNVNELGDYEAVRADDATGR